MHFLIDNPNLKLKLESISRKDLFFNEVNCGKFLTILQHVKSGHVKTKYFKVCDPDDFLSIHSLMKINLPKTSSELIINMPLLYTDLKFKKKPTNKELKEIKKRKKKYKYNFGNPFTILPTKSIMRFTEQNIQRVDSEDDQLLGIIALNQGAKYWEINSNFYIYLRNNGQTVLKNFPIQIKEALRTYVYIEKFNNVSNYEIKMLYTSMYKHFIWKRSKFEDEIRELNEKENATYSNLIEIIKSKISNENK